MAILVANHFNSQLVVEEAEAVPAFVHHLSRRSDPSGKITRWEDADCEEGEGSDQELKKGTRGNNRKRKRIKDRKMVMLHQSAVIFPFPTHFCLPLICTRFFSFAHLRYVHKLILPKRPKLGFLLEFFGK